MPEILPALFGGVIGRLLLTSTIIPIEVKFLSVQKASTEHRYHGNAKLKGESRDSSSGGNKTLLCSPCSKV